MRAPAKFRFAMATLTALIVGGFLGAQPSGDPVTLDSVVAVVNNHAILSSDIDRAMRLSVLETPDGGDGKLDRKSALDRLISRELILEQTTPEEKKRSEPTEEQLRARLALLREELPACARYHCTTDAGWEAFLTANGLTQNQVVSYLRLRLSLLSFIESRFRQGVHISQEEIEDYYRDKFAPEYPPGHQAPPLPSVAPRISEILLQQHVTQLFDAWLDNLRKQGDVEILDPALKAEGQKASEGGEQ